MFCNRLCRTQSEKVHPLLCPARNPASVPLLKFARKAEWMALHALAQCTSRILLSAQRDDGTLDEDLQIVQGLAELGMEERFRTLRCVPFSRSARRIPIDDLTEEIRAESRTVKTGKRRTGCTSARSKLRRHQTIRESSR